MSFIIDGRIEFIHVPKTAGKWIESCCLGYIEPFGHRHSGVLTQLPSFAVARAPYLWFRSAHAYCKQRAHIRSRGAAKDWFQDTEYRKIGQLKSLGKINASLDDVLREYLSTMKGEYSRATLFWLKGATVLVDMFRLYTDLRAVTLGLSAEAGKSIRKKMGRPPVNVSQNKVDVKNTVWIEKLIDAEQEYYDYVLPKGVQHD